MSRGPEKSERIATIVEAVARKRLAESLETLAQHMWAWQHGKMGVFALHSQIMRHVARGAVLSARLNAKSAQAKRLVLRDAVELDLIEKQEFVALTGHVPEEIAVPLPLDREVSLGIKSTLPEKRNLLESLLREGPVLIHVDARCKGTNVPAHFQNDAKLVLRIGFNLVPPIPDFSINDQGLQAMLTFRGTPFLCWLPWTAIYAILTEDGRGMVWPEGLPHESAREELRSPPPVPPKPVTKPASRSAFVASTSASPVPPKKSISRGHLRLVP